jgi:hypothetical protein
MELIKRKIEFKGRRMSGFIKALKNDLSYSKYIDFCNDFFKKQSIPVFEVKKIHARGGPRWTANFSPDFDVASCTLGEGFIFILNLWDSIRKGELIGDSCYLRVDRDNNIIKFVKEDWKNPYSLSTEAKNDLDSYCFGLDVIGEFEEEDHPQAEKIEQDLSSTLSKFLDDDDDPGF